MSMVTTATMAFSGSVLAEAGGATVHGMGPTLMRLLALGYLALPLVLGAVAGLCLLIAALRKSLTGGAALALGGLSAVVVLGLIYAGPRHEALVEAGQVHELPDRLIGLFAIAYAVLPLFLALVAAISLLVATIRKALDGPSAAALGGLGAVIVAGTIYAVGAHVEDTGLSVPRSEVEASADRGAKAPASTAELEETARALREEIMELRRDQVVIDEKASRIIALGERVGRMAEQSARLQQQVADLLSEIERDRKQAAAEREAMRKRLRELGETIARLEARVERAPAAGTPREPAPEPAPAEPGAQPR